MLLFPTKVDYYGGLLQEGNVQYAVIAINVSNIKIELDIKCLNPYLSIGFVSDAQSAANTAQL